MNRSLLRDLADVEPAISRRNLGRKTDDDFGVEFIKSLMSTGPETIAKCLAI